MRGEFGRRRARVGRIGFFRRGENPLGYGALPDRMTRDEVAALTAARSSPIHPGSWWNFFVRPALAILLCAPGGFDLRSRFDTSRTTVRTGAGTRPHAGAAAVNARWRAIDLCARPIFFPRYFQRWTCPCRRPFWSQRRAGSLVSASGGGEGARFQGRSK